MTYIQFLPALLHPQGISNGLQQEDGVISNARAVPSTGHYLAILRRSLFERVSQETQERPPSVRIKTKFVPKANFIGTGAWPSEVGVHRVTWNSTNGLAAAGLLASATASGLCRVDELWGRWIKDKVPYTAIEHIRMELPDANAMDVDSDESDASI